MTATWHTCPDCGHEFQERRKARPVTYRRTVYESPMPGQFVIREVQEQPGETTDEPGRYGFAEKIRDTLIFGTLAGLGGAAATTPIAMVAPTDLKPVALGLGFGGSFLIATGGVWWFNIAEACDRERFNRWLASQVDAFKSDLRPDVPAPVVEMVAVHEKPEGGQIQRFGKLPVEVGRFDEFVYQVLSGRKTAYSEWTPRSKGFTRGEYDAISQTLKKSGAFDSGGNLTTAGRRAIRRYLDDRGLEQPPVVDFDSGESWY